MQRTVVTPTMIPMVRGASAAPPPGPVTSLALPAAAGSGATVTLVAEPTFVGLLQENVEASIFTRRLAAETNVQSALTPHFARIRFPARHRPLGSQHRLTKDLNTGLSCISRA